jgi:hypothetical protein
MNQYSIEKVKKNDLYNRASETQSNDNDGPCLLASVPCISNDYPRKVANDFTHMLLTETRKLLQMHKLELVRHSWGLA